jgi:hypothetical protein
MKRIKIMGLCVVALFAFSAMAATSAFAELHLYLECGKAPKVGKTYSGDYTSKECTLASKVETGGKYLLKTPSGKGAAFKTSSGVSTLDSYIPGEKPLTEGNALEGGTVVGTVVCKKSKGSGTIDSVTLSTVTINFEDCESSKEKCTGGPKAGDILTNELSTTPVLGLSGESLLWTYAAAAGRPTQLETEEASEVTPTAEFKCGEKSVVTYGGALGLQLGALETATKAATSELKVNAMGGQEHVFFIGDEVGQAFLVSFITPPGILLPSGETTTQKLKGGVIGIYPGNAVHD